MSRSLIFASALSAVSVLTLQIFLQWPQTSATPSFAAPHAITNPMFERPQEVGKTKPRGSEETELRFTALEFQLDELRDELGVLRDALSTQVTTAPSKGRAEPEGTRFTSTRDEPAPAREELQRILDEEAQASAVRMRDAEARFADEAPDMSAAYRLRDRLEAGFAEHDLLEARVESFECGRNTCRAELRFDDPEERALSDAILPMLLGVEGQVEVYPDEESGSLVLFAERHGSS
jgi:hypothetical protein